MAKHDFASFRLPKGDEVEAAVVALRQLPEHWAKRTGTHQIVLTPEAADRQVIEVPTLAMRLFAQILGEIAVGHAVRVVPVRPELTTQEAAELLDVSRPKLVKLLDEGVIPHTKAGAHRRVRLEDIVAYKEERDAASLKALEALARQAQKLKVGYE